jgi:hypothetical protein
MQAILVDVVMYVIVVFICVLQMTNYVGIFLVFIGHLYVW